MLIRINAYYAASRCGFFADGAPSRARQHSYMAWDATPTFGMGRWAEFRDDQQITGPSVAAAAAGPPATAASRGAAALALAAAGVLAAALPVWLVARSHTLRPPQINAAARGLIVGSYALVGPYTWWRRPASRLGLLIAAFGFVVALASLDASATPFEYSLGRVVVTAAIVLLMYVALCFPRDRLAPGVERRFVAAFVRATAVSWALVLLLASRFPPAGPLSDCAGSCPHNALQLVGTSTATTQVLTIVAHAITIIAIVIAGSFLLRKGRYPARLRRRAPMPLLFACTAMAISFAGFSF